ncbi:MAG: hypothetical protein AAF206_10460 [Bacteroidota bacterium]
MGAFDPIGKLVYSYPWKLIALPYGNFTAALRIKTIASSADTLDGFGVVGTYEDVRYTWYIPGLLSPLVSYASPEATAFGLPVDAVEIFSYMDQQTAVSIDSWDSQLSLNAHIPILPPCMERYPFHFPKRLMFTYHWSMQPGRKWTKRPLGTCLVEKIDWNLD